MSKFMGGVPKAKKRRPPMPEEQAFRNRASDPTALTTQAILREVEVIKEDLVRREAERHRELKGLRDLFTVKVDAMEQATALRMIVIDNLPDKINEEVSHLRSLTDERFSSVGLQFKERDTRTEREARDNKLAVDAAFAAQEKQAVAQNESNALAISKSETATSETIKTNRDLSLSEVQSLTKQVDELKLQVNTIIASGITVKEQRSQGFENRTDNRGAAGLYIGIVLAVIGVITFLISIIDLAPKG
jgi:cation transport regulator ChaB